MDSKIVLSATKTVMINLKKNKLDWILWDVKNMQHYCKL